MEPSRPGVEQTYRCQLCASPSSPPHTAVVNLPQRGWWQGFSLLETLAHTPRRNIQGEKKKVKEGEGGKKERRKGENPPHREYLSQRNHKGYKSGLFLFFAFHT